MAKMLPRCKVSDLQLSYFAQVDSPETNFPQITEPGGVPQSAVSRSRVSCVINASEAPSTSTSMLVQLKYPRIASSQRAAEVENEKKY